MSPSALCGASGTIHQCACQAQQPHLLPGLEPILLPYCGLGEPKAHVLYCTVLMYGSTVRASEVTCHDNDSVKGRIAYSIATFFQFSTSV